MCFKEVDLYELRRRLRSGIPSQEMRTMFSLPISAAWTVRDYVVNRIVEGSVVEKNGYYKVKKIASHTVKK